MTEQRSGIMAGAFIVTAIGAVLLLAFDFAGWQYSELYGIQTIYRNGYVGLLEGPYFLVVVAMAAPLIYASYVAYATMRAGGVPPRPNMLRYAFYGTVATAVACVVGGVVFLVSMEASDALDWWLDTGFYGGLVGGVLGAVLFRLVMRSESS